MSLTREQIEVWQGVAQTSQKMAREIRPDGEQMKELYRLALRGLAHPSADAKDAAQARLAHIFHDDADLARTVYDYAIRGHLSYHNQLRERFAAIAQSKGEGNA